jgi:hypothetical protein
MNHCKGYPDMYYKGYYNVSLKRLWWQVTDHCKGYPDVYCKGYYDVSLKRLQWQVMDHCKAYPKVNWKCYSDVSLKRLRWRMTDQWKDCSYRKLKRLFWRVTKKAMITNDGSLLLLNYRRYYYPLLDVIKVCYEGRSIHTERSQTMGSKEPEPWSPQWVRQKHREANNNLPPNDLNHDEKSPIDAERPLCKYDLDC